MKLFRGFIHSFEQIRYKSDRPAVVTIGNFDGVHRGHQAILEQLTLEAKKRNALATVVTFEPHPEEFFLKDKAPARLSRFAVKWQLLHSFGVEQVCILRFSRQLSQMSAADFVDKILVEKLATKHLIIGDDFRFGHNRQGDYNFLQTAGKNAGFTVTPTPTVCDKGSRISSTLVREALRAGNMELAEKLLGHPYQLVGRVLHGDKRGRTIGFPTANLSFRGKISALSGVFALTGITAEGKKLAGVGNIGTRPTVNGSVKQLEAHWFDFEGDLYGQRLSVNIVKKIREEKRFNGLETLKQQIASDSEQARQILGCSHK